ncbi:transposase [Neisseria dentiae]|nr:transposase [Neisseria dentiae]STZ51882.1 transposase [Neisseria dentiae]
MRAKHPLKYLLHSAGIPKSSFHYHIGKADPDAAAKTAVGEVYRRHKGRYGHRRIAAVLSWNKKKVRRIMGLLGLKAKVRSKKTYRPQAVGEASDNILNREFTAGKPADKWPTDVTEFKCTDGKLYLSPILDEAFVKPPDVDAVQGVAAQRVQTYHTIGKRASSAQHRNAPQMAVLQRSPMCLIGKLWPIL